MKHVDIKVLDTKVRLCPADELRLEYVDIDPKEFEVNTTPDELHIVQKDPKNKVFNFLKIHVFNEDDKQPELIVHLPSPVELCKISVMAGSVDAQDLALDKLSIEGSVAKVVLSDVTSKNAHIKCVNGSAQVAHVTTDTLSVKCTNGSIQTADVRANNIRIDCTNGKISAERLKVTSRCEIETTNGSISLRDSVQEGDSLDVSTRVGRMSVLGHETMGKYFRPGDVKYILSCTTGSITVE